MQNTESKLRHYRAINDLRSYPVPRKYGADFKLGHYPETLQERVEKVNDEIVAIFKIKEADPAMRVGYYRNNFGSLLNAYREGDIGFDECIELMKQVPGPALASTPGMLITEAVEKIRNAESLKERHRTIDMEIVIHESSIEVSFGVWAGNRDYKGATLENAVNSCLVTNKEFSGTQEEADRVVREAVAYQEQRL